LEKAQKNHFYILANQKNKKIKLKAQIIIFLNNPWNRFKKFEFYFGHIKSIKPPLPFPKIIIFFSKKFKLLIKAFNPKTKPNLRLSKNGTPFLSISL